MQICFETQEALFAATVNCEKMSQQLRALAVDTAEQQARWRAMDAERQDQLQAMRITVRYFSVVCGLKCDLGACAYTRAIAAAITSTEIFRWRRRTP